MSREEPRRRLALVRGRPEPTTTPSCRTPLIAERPLRRQCNAPVTGPAIARAGWSNSRSRRPGCFRPIGSNGFYQRGPRTGPVRPAADRGLRHGLAPASRPTTPPTTPLWLQETRLAFEWFLGSNDLGLDLYDAKTGGCCDGLQEDRVNLNQGAESTLAFLLSLGEMKLLESTLATFRQVQ